MHEMNINWDDLKLFLAVARAGGLSGATQATGKSAPTLGRRMQVLEEITGHELFYRLPRGYELTEQGNELLNKVIELEAKILPLDRSSESLGGLLVKVSAGSWMTHVLCKHIQRIVEGNEATRLRFISADQILNISRRETVIGIRNQRPEQENLVCRKIGRVRFAGYALDKSVNHWIKVQGNTPSAQWLEEHIPGDKAMEVTAPRNALDLANAGAGRVLLPTFIGDHEPKLARVTTTIAELSHDQWLVTHQDDRYRSEVRLTIDRIYEVAKALHSVRAN